MIEAVDTSLDQAARASHSRRGPLVPSIARRALGHVRGPETVSDVSLSVNRQEPARPDPG